MIRKWRTAAVLVIAAAVLCALAGCSSAESEAPQVPVPGGHTEEEEPVGLIGFESPEPDGFTFEILPDADLEIYEMDVEYRLGDDTWGSEVMKTEDGSSFGLDDVVLKVFRIEDLEVNDTIPPMTLSFIFTDANGNRTPAENEYTVEAPQREGWYMVKITGSREAGYRLTNE